MSKIDMKVQMALLKEAKVYLKEMKKAPSALTKEDIMDWLEVFYEDKIKMDTCNEARVRR